MNAGCGRQLVRHNENEMDVIQKSLRVSRLTISFVALPILCGLAAVLFGRTLVAKILFEPIADCFLKEENITVRLYVGSFGATTAYTELATIQEGWLPHERIFFSSYGYPLVKTLSCQDSEVRLTGYATLTTDQLRNYVDRPIVLNYGRQVDEKEIITWDPVRILCGLPLLFLGTVLFLFTMRPARLGTLRESDP